MADKTATEDSTAAPRADDKDMRVLRETEVTQGTVVENLPHSDDPVDEASEDSFPASDPPAYSGRREDESSA